MIDAHFHIWQQADLPWLVGPMQPRIFGPYEPIRRDYPIEEYLADAAAGGITGAVYVQANWAPARALDEVAFVAEIGPSRRLFRWPLSAMPTCWRRMCGRSSTHRPVSPRLWRAHAIALARKPALRFAASPDLARDPRLVRNVGRLADYGWSFDLQVFASQMDGAAALAAACPGVTFVLQHAGMLEDLSEAGIAEWRAGMATLAAQPNIVSKLSGLGTFLRRNDAAHIAFIAREHWRCLARNAACSAQTSRSRSSGQATPILSPLIVRQPLRFPRPTSTAFSPGRPPNLQTDITRRNPHAAGNQGARLWRHRTGIELPRARARLRSAPPCSYLWLFDPRRALPVVVDTGYRHNQIMESLGMRGCNSTRT